VNPAALAHLFMVTATPAESIREAAAILWGRPANGAEEGRDKKSPFSLLPHRFNMLQAKTQEFVIIFS